MLSLPDAPRRLQAAAAAVRGLDKDVRKGIRDASKSKVVPMMIDAARASASTGLERSLAARGRYSAYRDIPGVAFGGTRALTSNGTAGRVIAHGIEEGSAGNRFQTVATTSPAGTRYTVRRRTTRQFMPDHSGSGFIAVAAGRIAGDVLELWASDVEAALIAALDAGA